MRYRPQEQTAVPRRVHRTRPATLPPAPRHPLVATAMALPVAAVLAVAFGRWDQVVAQASSVAGVTGR